MKDDDKTKAQQARSIGLALSIPAVLAAAAVVGCIIGTLLDRWLGTTPWLFLLFLFLGLGAGMRETIKLIQKMNKK